MRRVRLVSVALAIFSAILLSVGARSAAAQPLDPPEDRLDPICGEVNPKTYVFRTEDWEATNCLWTRPALLVKTYISLTNQELVQKIPIHSSLESARGFCALQGKKFVRISISRCDDFNMCELASQAHLNSDGTIKKITTDFEYREGEGLGNLFSVVCRK